MKSCSYLWCNILKYLWDNPFKKGPSRICGRQPLKNLKWYGLKQTILLQFFKGYLRQILLGPFLNTLSQVLLYIKKYTLWVRVIKIQPDATIFKRNLSELEWFESCGEILPFRSVLLPRNNASFHQQNTLSLW